MWGAGCRPNPVAKVEMSLGQKVENAAISTVSPGAVQTRGAVVERSVICGAEPARKRIVRLVTRQGRGCAQELVLWRQKRSPTERRALDGARELGGKRWLDARSHQDAGVILLQQILEMSGRFRLRISAVQLHRIGDGMVLGGEAKSTEIALHRRRGTARLRLEKHRELALRVLVGSLLDGDRRQLAGRPRRSIFPGGSTRAPALEAVNASTLTEDKNAAISRIPTMTFSPFAPRGIARPADRRGIMIDTVNRAVWTNYPVSSRSKPEISGGV